MLKIPCIIVATTTITTAGIKPEKAFATPVGTPSGILILMFFFKNQEYAQPTISPIKIAPIMPFPAVQSFCIIFPTISPFSDVIEDG